MKEPVKAIIILSVMLAVIITAALLTGCGKSKKKSKPCKPTVKVSAPASPVSKAPKK